MGGTCGGFGVGWCEGKSCGGLGTFGAETAIGAYSAVAVNDGVELLGQNRGAVRVPGQHIPAGWW